ncbi:MAG: DUF6503 family protein [Croceivirga sp.]
MKTLVSKSLSLLVLVVAISCGPKAKKEETTEPAVVEEMNKAPMYNIEDPQSILAAIEHASGGWNDLWNKKNVSYDLDYRVPANNVADVSTEYYFFENEASLAKYSEHKVNFMQDKEGEVTQYFDGANTKVMVNGKISEDEQLNAVSNFLRRTNYYWFAMAYKLNDKGSTVSYEGQESYNDIDYDILKISYDATVTGKNQNDFYIVYVNPETKMIDRLFFSLPFLGVEEPVIAANFEYENIDGQMISTTRSFFIPTEEGYAEEPSIYETMTNIKFNNDFTPASLISQF